MRLSLAVLAVLTLLHGATAANPEQIAVLIDRLGNTDYRQRQAAFRELDALGDAALAMLRVKSNSGDSEIRSRATELIRRIEQRQMSAKILKPTLVTIDFDNVPLREAVSQVAKTVNMPLTLANFAKSDRRVTYHSGKTPTWEALQGFLHAARLVEWDGLTQVPGLPAPAMTPEMQQQVFFNGPNPRVIINGTRRQANAVNLMLVYDGDSPALPIDSSSAVRVRILPLGTPIPNATNSPDELLIPCQISMEARIDWSATAPSIKMANAIDDQGQTLIGSVVSSTPLNTGDMETIMINNMIANQMVVTMGSSLTRSQFLPLRLKRGALPTKSLKELNGIVSLPIRVNDELAGIDRPLTVGGNVARSDFAELTLHSIERTGSEIRAEIALTLSPDAQIASSPNMRPGNVRINGGFAPQFMPPRGGANVESDEFYGISLTDAKSSRYSIVSTGSPNITYNTDGLNIRTTLTFTPKSGAGEPARLSVNGSRPASVELAFQLKDVPAQ